MRPLKVRFIFTQRGDVLTTVYLMDVGAPGLKKKWCAVLHLKSTDDWAWDKLETFYLEPDANTVCCADGWDKENNCNLCEFKIVGLPGALLATRDFRHQWQVILEHFGADLLTATMGSERLHDAFRFGEELYIQDQEGHEIFNWVGYQEQVRTEFEALLTELNGGGLKAREDSRLLSL